MRFNVAQLIQEPSGSTRTFDIKEEMFVENEFEDCKITGDVRLLRTDLGVWISADLHSKVQYECRRCLENYIQPVNLKIEEECLPILLDHTTADLNEMVFINDKHIIDMSETIKQYLSISLPMNPICKSDCAGIPLNQDMNSKFSTHFAI